MKGFLLPTWTAAGPIIQGVYTHWKDLRTREHWIRDKKAILGTLGRAHLYLDELPTVAHKWLMVVVVLASVAYVIASTSDLFGDATGDVRSIYLWFFLAWVILLPAAFTNFIPWILVKLTSVFPPLRRQIGWANASWHVEFSEDAPAAAVTTGDVARGIVDEILIDLIENEDNPNRALRPEGLTDDEAANMLVVGHVVESVLTSQDVFWTSSAWTDFYSILGDIATERGRMFSEASISNLDPSSFFSDLREHYNRRATEHLPDIPQMEHDVCDALTYVKNNLFGDARSIGLTSPVGAASYEAALKGASKVPGISVLGIQRQLAKLLTIWSVWDSIHKPNVFRVPFSSHMAIYLIDRGLLLVAGGRFPVGDDRFVSCFESAQKAVLLMGMASLTRSNRETWVRWREREHAEASDRGIDWEWYFMYRLDQYIYNLSRLHTSDHWTIESQPRSIVRMER